MAQANTAAPARKLPGSLETNRRLDRWLSINADGTVTLYTGKVEIGHRTRFSDRAHNARLGGRAQPSFDFVTLPQIAL